MKLFQNIGILAILSIAFFSCNQDDPIIPNEDELITTVIYTLTPVGGGDAAEVPRLHHRAAGADAEGVVEGHQRDQEGQAAR